MRREFSSKTKVEAFKRAGGFCEGGCGSRLYVGKYAYDHENPDGLTGEPTLENCRVLCSACHVAKTKDDVRNIAKAKRRQRKHIGAKKPSTFACSRASKWKKKINGQVVMR